MKRKGRGFLLLVALFLTVILVTMGMAFLSSRSAQYRSTYQAVLACQAREVARAGMEDARVKFNKDLLFPVEMDEGQSSFIYSETLVDASSQVIGKYEVVVDMTYAGPPFQMVRIQSTGRVGGPNLPGAEHRYAAYLNLARGTPGYFKFMRWDDQGSL